MTVQGIEGIQRGNYNFKSMLLHMVFNTFSNGPCFIILFTAYFTIDLSL